MTVIQKYVATAAEMENLLDVINQSPARNGALARLGKAIESKETEKERLIKFLNDLYPDFKNELITKEQYLQFKGESETKIADVDLTLLTLKEQIAKADAGIDGSNEFIANFKKYQNITALTRDAITELIHMIYVEQSGGIRIEFRFQDAFEQATEYIETNKSSLKR